MKRRWPRGAVVFEYTPIPDPGLDGGGASVDYDLKRGLIIEGQGRCPCGRCRLILGNWHPNQEGYFVPSELRPLTPEAKAMWRAVRAGGGQ